MKLTNACFLAAFLMSVMACKEQPSDNQNAIVASGQMPAMAADDKNKIHVVFGNADSILYVHSAETGQSFTVPTLAAILPNLAASHSRGPQIATTKTGLCVIACDEPGDIFSYTFNKSGGWSDARKINDRDTVAKEGLLALSADGDNAFAVWLDLRSKNNQVFGAKSNDGGKTWSSNMLIYASPDTTVCECCKPSVLVKGNNVYVMFRNWLNGNRDLYLIESKDGGNSFGNAQKLGTGSWKVNGCPVDGGGLAVDNNGTIQTVWRREGKIFECIPGNQEREIGEGKGCAIAIAGGKNVYAWTESREVVCMMPNGRKQLLGKGNHPVIKAIGDNELMCVWDNNKEIRSAIVRL